MIDISENSSDFLDLIADPLSKFRLNCGSSVDLGPGVGPRPIVTKRCQLEL